MNYQVYIKRKEKRLRQSDVARKLIISTQSYHLKETGKNFFTVPEAVKLAKLFNCSLDELFGDSAHPQNVS